MSDEPTRLVIVNGMTADQLRAWAEQMKVYRWQGIPILPVGCECQIIELPPRRVEPEIEDEP